MLPREPMSSRNIFKGSLPLEAALGSPLLNRGSAWRYRLVTLALSLWTALLACYCLTLVIFTAYNDDQSWYIYAAKRMLAGAHISGPEIVDFNPPLITWFSAIPVMVAHALRLEPYLALKLLVLLLIAASTLWCARILRAAGVVRSAALLCICVVSVLSAETYLTCFELGQREHLVIILILPYLFSAVCSGKSKLPIGERCALGLAAGLAVCFKPQQVFILVSFEIFLALWNRSLRHLISAEFVCAVQAVVAYIISVRLFAPLYLSHTVPLARETYWAFGPASTWTLIKSQPVFDLLFLAALITFLWKRRSFAFPIAPAGLLTCTLAASIAFYVQHVGATEAVACRTYPQHAFLLLTMVWIATDLFLPHDWTFSAGFAATTTVAALVLLPAFLIVGGMFAKAEPAVRKFPDTVLAQCHPGTSVYLFSPSPWVFPIVLQRHLQLASRSPGLWMLPAIVQDQLAEAGGPPPGKLLTPETVSQLADLQRAETTEDFQRWKPELVIVQQCSKAQPCQGMAGIDFDPVVWFLHSQDFAAEWSHYRLQTHHDNFDVYTRIH